MDLRNGANTLEPGVPPGDLHQPMHACVRGHAVRIPCTALMKLSSVTRPDATSSTADANMCFTCSLVNRSPSLNMESSILNSSKSMRRFRFVSQLLWRLR